MTEAMAQWLHRANVEEMLRATKEKEVWRIMIIFAAILSPQNDESFKLPFKKVHYVLTTFNFFFRQ